MQKIHLVFFLLFFYLILNYPFTSGYQNNEVPEFEPDDKQFMVCKNALKNGIEGQNYYHINRNKISEPLEGPYSNFIDMFNIRKMDNFYYSPICEKTYPSRNTFHPIFDRKILIDDNEGYRKEKELDDLELNDPFYIYGNPKSIQNKLTYDNEKLEEIFINTRDHLVQNEEDYQTRVKYQRYFIDYPNYS